MGLDRWIALVFFLICCVYGYEAFVTMQASLLPFERNMAFLPNSLPKGLAVLGAFVALTVLVTARAHAPDGEPLGEIDYRRLTDYKLGQALLLLALMVAYAIALRPVGFLAATFLFLFGGSWILGERRYVVMLIAAALGSGVVWYLVQEVLGIFLRPLPWFV